jgi:hypothetical protein
MNDAPMSPARSPEASEIAPPVDWRRRAVASAAVVGWLLVVGLIASSYIGHSSSPYGVCYADSGRSVPCELARH